MFSSRRVAQLGLASACLILAGSVAVLVVGGSDAAQPGDNSTVTRSVHAQASSTIGNLQAQIPEPMVVAKR